MAPLTQTAFDEWTASSIWPRPTYLLAAGSVAFLILYLRRHLTIRRYVTNYTDAKTKTDVEDTLMDLPPPLRSVYRYHHDIDHDGKSSSMLAIEAAMGQLYIHPNPTVPVVKPNRRHSCPIPASLLPQQPIIEEPPSYSDLQHDSVEHFPVLDSDGNPTPGQHWRRRTLIYG